MFGPRLDITRFHGVLAQNAKVRALVVLQELKPPAQTTQPAKCEVTKPPGNGALMANSATPRLLFMLCHEAWDERLL